MKWIWLVLVLLILVIFVLQIVLFTREREYYKNTTPLKFTKQHPSYTVATRPYMGNTWPNADAEPFSERLTPQKKAIQKRMKTLVSCEKAWRDCHANQNCEKTFDDKGKLIRSQCVPKKEAYHPKWLGKY